MDHHYSSTDNFLQPGYEARSGRDKDRHPYPRDRERTLDLTKNMHRQQKMSKKSLSCVNRLLLGSNKIKIVKSVSAGEKDTTSETAVDTIHFTWNAASSQDITIGGYFYLVVATSSKLCDETVIRTNIAFLSELDLSGNIIAQVPGDETIHCLQSLRKLSLQDNKLTDIPISFITSLASVGRIEVLNLMMNCISSLPSEIGLLTSLKTLKVSSNRLVELPKEIAAMMNLTELRLEKNNLINPLQSIAEKGGLAWIRTHFHSLADRQTTPEQQRPYDKMHLDIMSEHSAVSHAGPRSQLKLLVVGHERVGKTSLVSRLKSKSAASTDTTHMGTESCSDSSPSTKTSSHQCSDPPSTCLHPMGSTKDDAFLRMPRGHSDHDLAPTRISSSSTAVITGSFASSSSSTGSDKHLTSSSTVGIDISKFHIKTKNLELFREKAASLAKKHHQRYGMRSLLKNNIKYVVFDFAGQEVYHTVHKIFFSQFALHLIVYDVSAVRTVHDCDKFVQFWVDLIQAAVPGSSMVIAATHCDLLTEEEISTRIEMLKDRLRCNEEFRLADLQKDIRLCKHDDKRAELKHLEKNRPRLDPDRIIPIGESRGIEFLLYQLVMSHPFMDIDVPDDYEEIVRQMKELKKKEHRSFCTINELQSRCNTSAERIKMAAEYFSSVGEVLWLGSGHTQSAVGRSSTLEGDAEVIAAAAVGEFLFLDPVWLVTCIKSILNHKLFDQLNSSKQCAVCSDSGATSLLFNRANRGVIEWRHIKSYLLQSYDEQLLDVIRLVLEKFEAIIPLRCEAPAPSNPSIIVLSSSKSSSAPPPRKPSNITRCLSAAEFNLTDKGSTIASSSSGVKRQTSVDSYMGSIASSGSQQRQPSDQQFYLIPGLLTPYCGETTPLLSGFITLERNFHFVRFTPPGIVQSLFFKVGCSQLNSSVDAHWDTAFIQEHRPVKIFVKLVVAKATASSQTDGYSYGLGGDGSSTLHIQGIGHVLNSHLILDKLDKYTRAVQSILGDIRGLGAVPLTSTCPECLMNTSATRKGEFLTAELDALQQQVKMLVDKLSPQHYENNRGAATAATHHHDNINHELRKWHRKRHTCPLNQCQVKSDMLVVVPKVLQRAIEKTSKAEHTLHYLLDECVRTYAEPSLQSVSKSVVRVMAVHILQHCYQSISAYCLDQATAVRTSSSIPERVCASPLSIASGVVVSLSGPVDGCTDNAIGADTADHHHTAQVAVLTCDHLITKVADQEKGTYVAKFAEKNLQTVFLIGDQTHWLYLAELVYQGSSHPISQTCFWDVCALRILAPIVPIAFQSVTMSRFNFELCMYKATTCNDDHSQLQHPYYPPPMTPPLSAVLASSGSVAVDQVVRLLGYPDSGGLSADWGRVMQNNPNSDILVSVLSDDGSSGGPVLDRSGRLIGLLSRSHESIKCSCVQPLRDLLLRVKGLLLSSSSSSARTSASS